MQRYFGFGLTIMSTEAIPGLVRAGENTPADLTVWVGTKPDSTQPAQPIHQAATRAGTPFENRRLFRLTETDILWIRFDDGTDFYVDREGKQIWTTWTPPYTIEDMATYLLGPVIGYILRIRGAVALHASSFVISERAIALLGGAGAGKSTTVAAMAIRGLPVLADDVTVLEEDELGFRALPSYPHLRLWPESVELLHGSADRLKPITPNWDKRDFNLQDGYRFQTRPARLDAIYELGDRVDDDRAPWIEEMDGREQLIHLVGNTYANGFLDDSMRMHEFNVLGRLIKHVKVRRVVPHVSADRLGQLCDVILEDCS